MGGRERLQPQSKRQRQLDRERFVRPRVIAGVSLS